MVTLDGGAGKVAHLRLLHAPIEAGDRPLLLVFAEDVTVRVAQDEARTRFLEEVAHQFRTPLTPIAAYAELLFDGGLSPDERIEASESIRHHAAELRSLLEQLTGLLRLRSSLSLDLGPVTMGAVIDEIGSALPGSGGAIAARGEAEVTVLTHLEAASRGLAELVSNSITHGIPPVQVAWERGDGFVEVVVRDGGPGPSIMDGATFSKVWDVPRAGNVVSPSMGHQLGLARAAAYLEQAGATLVFHRGDGPWAFTVRFPI
jgi:signal transduction histidine kinase